MNTNQAREAFESMMRQQYPLFPLDKRKIGRHPNFETIYLSAGTQHMWNGWSARPASPPVEGWMPIETAPIEPFNAEEWYRSHSPYLLLFNGNVSIGSYGFTQRGKGRWRGWSGVIEPTHWMPLPPNPVAIKGSTENLGREESKG